MSRIVHFEIPVKNAEKVADFYRQVFDWEITKWDGPVDYWLISTGEADTPGINGALYIPEGPPVTINTIDVDDLDAMLTKIKGNGGSVVLDKMAVPGVGWMAYCTDVEGTIFGLMQGDPIAGTNGNGA